MAASEFPHMPRRRAPLLDEPKKERPAAAEPEVSGDGAHGVQANNSENDEQRLLEMLADYFSVLREWSQNSRSDDGLAPDSTTDQP